MVGASPNSSPFTIDSKTGVLTVSSTAKLNYETQKTYTISVGVSDGTQEVIKAFTINIKDVLEAGQINLSTNLVAENVGGATVGTISSMRELLTL